jgi:hypothetical protein
MLGKLAVFDADDVGGVTGEQAVRDVGAVRVTTSPVIVRMIANCVAVILPVALIRVWSAPVRSRFA